MISIKNLSFRYKGNDSDGGGIRDINLEIQKGECVLLCGRSGCGKSTLLKLLNGLIPRYFPGELSGEIWMDFQNSMGNQPSGEKRIDTYSMYELSEKVGTVFQNPRTQFFNVDVNSEIVFGMENFARSYDHMEARRRAVLQDFELDKLSENSIFDLSGGEKQRVAFGSVYAGDPELYLLDEPSSNLDTHTVEKLTEYIRTIKSKKKTVLVAEHRLYYLMAVVDRVIYMDKGSIVRDMTREEFLALSDSEMKQLGLRTRNILPVKQEVREREYSSPGREADFEGVNLSVMQNKKTILAVDRLQAVKGDIIGVVGRNGIGKTTLIRYLCGLHSQGSGRITLSGRELGSRERTRTAYIVMQDVNYQLFAESVLAECSFGLKEYDQELAEQLLRRFGLWEVRFKHPNTLSGGQKQRLAVIAGCVSSREILIFDEPTSGLDYDSMNAMAEIIKEISREKIVFVVTHDYEFITKTCTGLVDLELFAAEHKQLPKGEE